MAVTASQLVSGLTHIVQDFFDKKALRERRYSLPVLEDAAMPETILKEGNGYVARFFRPQKVDLAQDITYGTDLTTGKTLATDQFVAQVRLFGDFISIDPFGDAVRFWKVIDWAYEAFREQAQRTAWYKLRAALHVGSTYWAAGGSESFSAAGSLYAGGAATLADLVAGQNILKATDLHRARGKLGRNGGVKFSTGRYRCALNDWQIEQLVNDDPAFRDLWQGTSLDPFKTGVLFQWGGCDIVYDDMPFRCSAGAETTFASSGQYISALVYGKDSFGSVKHGKGGILPKWKHQDISKVPLVEETLGYAVPAAYLCLNSAWVYALKSAVDPAIAADTSA